VGDKKLKKMVEVLQVLANPIRLKIIAMLAERPMYAYEIAKKLKISYPLAHLHLSSLERAGLIKSEYSLSGEEAPKVRRYYRVKDFDIRITPETIKKLVEGDKK